MELLKGTLCSRIINYFGFYTLFQSNCNSNFKDHHQIANSVAQSTVQGRLSVRRASKVYGLDLLEVSHLGVTSSGCFYPLRWAPRSQYVLRELMCFAGPHEGLL
jgi:hypothetical protein